MFGSSKPVVLQPYGRRRSRGRPPRWLVLLLIGVAAGALGVVFVQERYLPPRLSAHDSTQLRSDFQQADAERQRLQRELNNSNQKLATTLADNKGQADALATSRTTIEHLHDDMSAVVASLPPDPRGGSVQVRAGQFTTKAGMLLYDVVLTRERNASRPMNGVMQLAVAGQGARGADTTVTLKPITFSIGSQEVVRGSQPLPEGFRPREATVQVLDRVAGRALGMRVMLVNK